MQDLTILQGVRKKVGGEQNGTAFDEDLLDAINAAFGDLWQIGVTKDIYQIEGEEETWDDFYEFQKQKYGGDEGDRNRLNLIKQYVYLKTRLTFDPPQNSALLNSITAQLDELTFRIQIQYDGNAVFDPSAPPFEV